jgi:prepilin-type N-terminal cleavage/methylation domain-containing protein
MRAARRERRMERTGFTLWELTMVLLVMAVATTLAAPAFARLGAEQQTRGADRVIALLRDARKASLEFDAIVTLRLDPKTLKYQVDTSTVAGVGTLAAGMLDLGSSETLVSEQPRLLYLFRPTGSAIADTVVVRGGEVPLVIRVDQWSGVARADTL